MTREQTNLLSRARESVAAARLLQQAGHHGFAASRAYYSMFYIAEAFLLGKGLSFSRHSAVHAAFGQHFTKAGTVPVKYQSYLVGGMEVRHAGDYDDVDSVSAEEALTQINRAQEFLDLAGKTLQ